MHISAFKTLSDSCLSLLFIEKPQNNLNCWELFSNSLGNLLKPGLSRSPLLFLPSSLFKKSLPAQLWALLSSSSGPEPRNTLDTSLTPLHFQSVFKSYCLYLLTNVLRVSLAPSWLAEVLCWNSVDLYSCSFNTSRSLLPSLIYTAQNNQE